MTPLLELAHAQHTDEGRALHLVRHNRDHEEPTPAKRLDRLPVVDQHGVLGGAEMHRMMVSVEQQVPVHASEAIR